eukprot:CCRYP_002871-RA/>CCRYP_002871-RA protein AED:0.99 eAED:1.00 QI:0/0/0/0.33/1/1/3/0/178
MPRRSELKNNHLTFELNDHVPSTTGIPPHVAHLRKITTVEGCCIDIKDAVMEFKSELRDSISQAIDDKVEESGGINASILDSRILALEQRLVNRLDQMGTVTVRENRVEELKNNHLTFELNDHVPSTTGIPPHVAHLRKITTVEGCCIDIKDAVMEFKSELRDSISQAIDDKVEESGV